MAALAPFDAVAHALDDASDLVCITDASGRIVFVNRAWQRALGYTGDEARALAPVSLVLPEYRAAFLDVARQLHTGIAVDDFEAVLLTRTGRRLVCRGHAFPDMLPADGTAPARCVRVRAYYRDVTEERHHEALRSRLVATLEASPDYVAVKTRDGQLLYVNQAGRRLVGLSEDAPLDGRTCHELRPVAERQRFTDEIVPAALRDGRWIGESALLAPDGAPIPVEMRVVAHPSSRADDASPYFISTVARDLRATRAAEAALRRSEARHRSVLEAMAEGVVVHARDGRIVAWNASAERILGRAGDVLKQLAAGDADWALESEDGAPLPPAQHPWARALAAAGTAAPSGDPAATVDGVVLSVRTPDGGRRWLRLSARALDTAGPPTETSGGDEALDEAAVVVTFADITEERRAQLEIARLSEVVSHTDDAVVVTDAAGRIEWVNAAFERITGWPLGDVVGRTPGSVLQGADTDPATRQALGAAVRAGEGIAVEILNYRRDGTPYWLALTITPLRAADGTLTGFVAVERDVTARRRAERERQELATAVAIAPDGISLTDADGVITYVNAAHAAIYGYAPEDVIGRTWHVFYARDEAERLTRDVLPLLTVDGHWRGEAMGLRRDGSTFPQALALTRLPWGGLVCSVHDIAERKAGERALEERSIRDELTGLLNRRGFFQRAEQALTDAITARHPCVLLYGDVDRFKAINDTYGHDTGDRALCAVATALAATARPLDVVGRLGGDEFVVLLVGAGPTAADPFAARVHATLAGEPASSYTTSTPHTQRGQACTPLLPAALATPAASDALVAGTPTVCMSLGHAAWNPGADGGESAGELLARLLRAADQALYREKHERRGRLAEVTAPEATSPGEPR